MPRTVFFATAALLVLTACNEPKQRLNAPPHGTTDKTSDMQGTFVYMSDNAMLADMSIADMHFLPHRAQLTTLGEERLARLVSLMEEYGGVIRFNTSLEDQALVDARTKTVMDFLAEAGVDTTKEVLTRDLPGGDGMDATEAILIKAKEGTYSGNKRNTSTNGTGTTSGTSR